MRISTNVSAAALFLALTTTDAFQPASFKRACSLPIGGTPQVVASKSPLFSAATGSGDLSTSKQLSRKQLIRKEGGPFAFSTKYGALNLYAIYYGLVAIGLGIPWFVSLKIYSFFQFLTRGRFDKYRRIPTTLNHLWGVTLMFLTRSFPQIENKDVLEKFYKEYVPTASFVIRRST